eukprot:1162016-Pelagomonas_calceolata.AAC.16
MLQLHLLRSKAQWHQTLNQSQGLSHTFQNNIVCLDVRVSAWTLSSPLKSATPVLFPVYMTLRKHEQLSEANVLRTREHASCAESETTVYSLECVRMYVHTWTLGACAQSEHSRTC